MKDSVFPGFTCVDWPQMQGAFKAQNRETNDQSDCVVDQLLRFQCVHLWTIVRMAHQVLLPLHPVLKCHGLVRAQWLSCALTMARLSGTLPRLASAWDKSHPVKYVPIYSIIFSNILKLFFIVQLIIVAIFKWNSNDSIWGGALAENRFLLPSAWLRHSTTSGWMPKTTRHSCFQPTWFALQSSWGCVHAGRAILSHHKIKLLVSIYQKRSMICSCPDAIN